MIKFAIVIPCLNEVAYIGPCIQSILDQDQEGVEVEVFVVDGLSTDGTREIIETFVKTSPRIHLIDNHARVTPVALNLGIKASKADVIAILGAHAVLKPAWLIANVKALNAHPDAGCVGGVIENVHENNVARIISLAMQSPFGVGNARFRTGGKAGYVDTVAFGAYRREVFEHIGLFDERLVRNQDDEFNFRLTASGYKVWFDPTIASLYFVRGSFAKLAMQYRQYGYWKVYVNTMHRTVTTGRQLIPFLFVSFLLLGALASMVWPPFSVLYFAVILLWLMLALLVSIRIKSQWRDLLPLIRTFFTLHFFYGWGYAQGLFDFLLFGKKPDSQNPSLTR